MHDLLFYIVKNLIQNEEFEIEENTDNHYSSYTIKVKPSDIGMIIGKGGVIIKSIRNILKVRAIIEKRAVSVNVIEK